jgi:hypothetical protein
MKATTLQSFLEDCRKVQTADGLGDVLDEIEAKIGGRAGRARKIRRPAAGGHRCRPGRHP